MTALASDSRPRRFGKNRGIARHIVAGKKQALVVTTYNLVIQKSVPTQPSSPFPPLKSAAAPALRAGMEPLLMMNDVTKLLSGVMPRLALQGDGPLREPSPRQQGILCAVVNH
ncbi:hypothetical protein RNH31_003627 [Salmonella enterica]|nr:hypothetical protein [Salmonella enterica]